ncbi:DUF3050 domain-containing protein [Aureibacter tunicatorum]|uniref:Heme oxygenase n=1 Tax=Aureibacter tunicatorum TaxID=866807 RepID=A0AAE3XM03_9BACT|nr:DUF3050 domain-containing protein [Aureibacter tunicatorum]MDR6238246.1 hypothetical protein [Aureibacter tunicatorum]BDD03279.1 hypothetical protein AUTU_07620 [Aureibacter tunicatorum]
MSEIEKLEQSLIPLRLKLTNHSLYNKLSSLDDIKTFMESHVFAVWDFMSLLKALQFELTCNSIPWIPAKNPVTARFINEIVLGEESDVDSEGLPKSHYEMYLDAMRETGADTLPINSLLEDLINNKSLEDSIDKNVLFEEVANFLRFTFEIIKEGKIHKIASAFTFGREDIIPDMFMEIIRESEAKGKQHSRLEYYLKRHIELDGDEHGPLSLKMMEELCGNDSNKWLEASQTAQLALEHRINLWDGISKRLSN